MGRAKEDDEIHEENVEDDEEEDLIDVMGGNGRWQKTVFIIFTLIQIPCNWHSFSMSFLAPNIKHWCAKPPNYSNITKTEWIQMLEKLGSIDKNIGQCYIYDYDSGDTMKRLYEAIRQNIATHKTINHTLINKFHNMTAACHKWEYDDTMYNNTAVNKWDLVCDKDWMISLSKSLYMVGFSLSLLVMGQMADKVGRKPVIMISLCIFMISGIVSAFSVTFSMFAVCRLFIAFGLAGILNTGFVHLMEIITPESRSIYGMLYAFGWGGAFVLLPGLAWLIRDWQYLQLAITVPWIILFANWWLLPESPRWLITQGKIEEAQRVLLNGAKINGRNLSEIENALKRKFSNNKTIACPESKSRGLLDFIRKPVLFKRTLNISFAWFVTAFIYYALSHNTNDLAGDPFVNFAISGAIEFPSYIIAIYVIKTFGRRKPLMATLVLGGMSCLLTVPLTGSLIWLRMPLSMFGKLCITATFNIVYVYAAELFPTVVRNTGVGWCSICARFGSIIAPFVRELAHFTHESVPLICYGVLSMISGFLVILLPETSGIKVPDDIDDLEENRRKKRIKEDRSKSNKEKDIQLQNN